MAVRANGSLKGKSALRLSSLMSYSKLAKNRAEFSATRRKTFFGRPFAQSLKNVESIFLFYKRARSDFNGLDKNILKNSYAC